MSGDDLTRFIRARLDEDEAALKADEGPEGATRFVDADRWSAAFIRRFADNDRVQREVAAKRAVLAAYAPVADMDGLDEPEYAYGRANGLGEAVREIAAVYSGHPDYKQKWRTDGT